MSDSCKDSASTKSNDGLCEVIGKLQNMSTNDNNSVSVCANCNKEGANNLCNKCKMAKYCNAACKKKHRHKHKKDCEEHVRLAAEHAAKLHDEELFKVPPPQYGDCPICFLRLPRIRTGSCYQSCCGKTICSGCVYAPVYDDQGNKVDNTKCPFCRTPQPKSDEDVVKRLEKRVEFNDIQAMLNVGLNYSVGEDGYPQDYTKALEVLHRAAELGYAQAYTNIGYAYNHGEGVEVDEEKAIHYYELAAIGGDAVARFNLGCVERNIGNVDRAIKHYMIAVRGGHNNSLKNIKKLYTCGHATKEEYTRALQLYQAYLGEIKSRQRDEAAAAHDTFRYY